MSAKPKPRRFLISSLLMAGVMPAPPLHANTGPSTSNGAGDDPDADAVVRRFAQDHQFLLAAHRSHSSHSSHSSHRSGSSGTYRAPVYTPPAPRKPKVTPAPTPSPSSRNSRSTPPSSVLPSSPAIAPNSLYSAPSDAAISSVVRRVQMGLLSYGYYHGAIDGVVGAETRAALVRFQTDFKLPVTGTITPDVLDAFKIVAH